MLKIALDALGGDHAPSVIVEGAVWAAKEYADLFKIILCGPTAVVQAELDRLGFVNNGEIEIVDAPQIVAMDESPTDVLKTKQESGLVKCVALQKAGLAQASVSAGNSGAMMASCLMILGRAGRISRPAIASLLPTIGHKCLMLDLGANVDEKPSTLLDFAICGNLYAKHVMGIESPRIGLLNMGEEEKKGTESVREAYQLLKASSMNFVGNVEGRGFLKGEADVVVTPGYTGNVVLKMMEGFFDLHKANFGDLDTPASRKFNDEWDYENYGGALLLGLNGTGIIAHGRAEAKAIKVALKTAYDFAKSKVSEKIAAHLSE
jgi:glycerol-3-phosphate acyltransferase PlsX